MSNAKTLWYTRCPVPTPLGIASRLGWVEEEFARDGIEVRTLQDEVDPRIKESHFTHHLENSFRQGGNIPAIWARASGRDTKVVGLTWTDEAQVILTSPRSTIRTVADLKGKRLGVVTRPDDVIDFWKATTIRAYLVTLGLRGLTENDVTFVELPRAGTNATDRGWFDIPLAKSVEAEALAEGEVDVIFHKGSRGLELADAIGARILYDLANHPDTSARVNNGSPRTLTVDAGLIERDFPLVVRLLKRLILAGRWAEANRSSAIAYVAKETRSPVAAVERGYGPDVHRHLKTVLSVEHIKALGDFIQFLSTTRSGRKEVYRERMRMAHCSVA